MHLTLLTRQDCGLCEHAAALMRDMGLQFETVDIDRRPDLLALYTDAIPVVLAGGREVCRAPITREALRSSLVGINLGSRL
jgi:glutaredoxin